MSRLVLVYFIHEQVAGEALLRRIGRYGNDQFVVVACEYLGDLLLFLLHVSKQLNIASNKPSSQGHVDILFHSAKLS